MHLNFSNTIDLIAQSTISCRVHDLQFMDVLYEVEAHDAEILSIEYSDPSSGESP